jgi:hypothetical protein
VDHTGFSTLNSQRFGQKFVGRVANPHDMLAWHKAAVRRIKPGERGGEGGLRALPEPGARPEAMDEAEIEAQVSRHLVQTLQVISEADLAVALHNYIDKVGGSVVSCLALLPVPAQVRSNQLGCCALLQSSFHNIVSMLLACPRPCLADDCTV